MGVLTFCFFTCQLNTVYIQILVQLLVASMTVFSAAFHISGVGVGGRNFALIK